MREQRAPLLFTISCNELKKAGQDPEAYLDEHPGKWKPEAGYCKPHFSLRPPTQVVEKEHKLPVKQVNS